MSFSDKQKEKRAASNNCEVESFAVMPGVSPGSFQPLNANKHNGAHQADDNQAFGQNAENRCEDCLHEVSAQGKESILSALLYVISTPVFNFAFGALLGMWLIASALVDLLPVLEAASK